MAEFYGLSVEEMAAKCIRDVLGQVCRAKGVQKWLNCSV